MRKATSLPSHITTESKRVYRTTVRKFGQTNILTVKIAQTKGLDRHSRPDQRFGGKRLQTGHAFVGIRVFRELALASSLG
jgi:hypothetical protein